MKRNRKLLEAVGSLMDESTIKDIKMSNSPLRTSRKGDGGMLPVVVVLAVVTGFMILGAILVFVNN